MATKASCSSNDHGHTCSAAWSKRATSCVAGCPAADGSSTAGAPAPSSAQGTGLITGRVFNPNTGDYVRNAQITVQETGQTTYSGDGGEFNLAGVRPGRATVVVAYTGYRNASATVDVRGGGVAWTFAVLRLSSPQVAP